MGIKGLTGTGSESFPEIGKLRKGGAKKQITKTGKGGKPYTVDVYGDDLQYFRFDSKDAIARADFSKAYGDEPTEIRCMLHSDDIERVFGTCKEEWRAGGLVHRCDGENCTALRLEGGQIQRQFMVPVPCPGGCKEVGRLKLIVRGLNRFAYVTAETHSKHDIINLYNQLAEARWTFGQLTGIPFVLQRIPKEISTPTADGGRARREKWLLSIEVDPAWARPRLAAMEAIALQEAAMGQSLELPGIPTFAALPSRDESQSDFRKTKSWEIFTDCIEKAKRDTDPEGRLATLAQWAYKQIATGQLPTHARGAIDMELERAIEIMQARDWLPLDSPSDFPRPALAMVAAAVTDELVATPVTKAWNDDDDF